MNPQAVNALQIAQSLNTVQIVGTVVATLALLFNILVVIVGLKASNMVLTKLDDFREEMKKDYVTRREYEILHPPGTIPAANPTHLHGVSYGG